MNSPYKVFISYSHEDEAYRKQLDKHLATLVREGLIELWHDRKITPGAEWENEIDKHLETADIILLLVSSDFIASEYSNDIEVKRAIERHENRESVVIPIILRPADWSSTFLAKLQALPTDAKPISSWPNIDEAFLDVAKGIRRLIKEFEEGPIAREIEKLSDNSLRALLKAVDQPAERTYAQVDFSGKLDSFAIPTIAVVQNGKSRSVYVSANVKKVGMELLRAKHPELSKFNLRLRFMAIILFYLIRDDFEEWDEIVIDDEYPGYSGTIKTLLLNLLMRHHPGNLSNVNISVRQISKPSTAFLKAREVMKLKKLPDWKLRIGDVNKMI